MTVRESRAFAVSPSLRRDDEVLNPPAARRARVGETALKQARNVLPRDWTTMTHTREGRS